MRIALVVQRYGPEVLGGSESLARQYARLLSEAHDVEVLTTCAVDHITWRNDYPPGLWNVDSIPVRRFANDGERDGYWFELWRTVREPLDELAFADSPLRKHAHARKMAALPHALQLEVIRRQGPYSTPLLNYLDERREAYDAFLFFTYLFPTTYFGLRRVPAERALLCPTLHDEPMAYLPAYGEAFRRASRLVFLTEAERRLKHRLFGETENESVVGMALPSSPVVGEPPRGTPKEYLLYAGRIEEAKGMERLFEAFLAYKRRRRSALKLALIGTVNCRLPAHPDVVYLGFVSDAEKFALLRGAKAFVHPSSYESFSIVLLESFLMGTPALVTRTNEVLTEHCAASEAGFTFGSPEEFAERLDQLLKDETLRARMGQDGKRYVRDGFNEHVVRRRLSDAIEARTASLARSASEDLAGASG